MENQNERFKELIRQAQVLLNISPQELTGKYNELIRYTDREIPNNTIEIRLSEENITISCLINKQKQCTDVYFFFDRIKDENAFTNYLVDYCDYSFEKRIWLLSDCVIKTKEIKDITAFNFYQL